MKTLKIAVILGMILGSIVHAETEIQRSLLHKIEKIESKLLQETAGQISSDNPEIKIYEECLQYPQDQLTPELYISIFEKYMPSNHSCSQQFAEYRISWINKARTNSDLDNCCRICIASSDFSNSTERSSSDKRIAWLCGQKFEEFKAERTQR